ncbi:MAG TPA: MFS transporter [Chitinophagaceae bacterium]|nr:MFS transporter [Chitinophagaceae bacterium]
MADFLFRLSGFCVVAFDIETAFFGLLITGYLHAMSRKERILLFLLAGLNFTHILDFMIMMPLSNYLIPAFKITAFQFSILVASYSISAFISGLIIAMVIDKFDRKRSLLFAYAGFLIGTIACGFAPTYGLLLSARIMAGLFGGIIGAQVLSIVADLFVYERRGTAMGAVMSAFAAASILGVPLSLYLTNLFKFNWHVPFILIGSVGILLVPLIIRFVPSMTGHIKERKQDSVFSALTSLFKVREQRAVLLFSGLLMMGHFLIIPFINPYIEFNKGFSKELIPMIYLFGGIASLVGAIFLGRYSDKVGKLPVFLWSVFLSLFMALIITKMPNVHFSLVLCFFSVWFVLATIRAITAQAMISEVVKPEQRGSFMSVNGSIQQLGSGLAALAAGAIVITEKSGKISNYNWVGILSILVLAISMILGHIVFKKIDRAKNVSVINGELLQETV